MKPDQMLSDALEAMNKQVVRLKKKVQKEDLSTQEMVALERAIISAIRYMEHDAEEGEIVKRYLAQLSDEEWQDLVSGGDKS